MSRNRFKPIAVFALCACFLPCLCSAGGIGISSGSEGSDSVVVLQVSTLPFHFYEVPVFRSALAHRDFEFLWSDTYPSRFGRPLVPQGSSEENDLDRFGFTMCNTIDNPFNYPRTDIRLVHDFLNARLSYRSSTYDTNPLSVGFLGGQPAYPDEDRNHVDVYISVPAFTDDPVFGSDAGDGDYYSSTWSPFEWRAEDSLTVGSGAPQRHLNSFHLRGPRPSEVGDTGPNRWTRPGTKFNSQMNHEFVHVLNGETSQGGDMLHMFASAAEVLAGIDPEPPQFDVPFTWNLLHKYNYAAWLSFVAYLTYNFRGTDHTSSGLADDLLWRWSGREPTERTLAGLGLRLRHEECLECDSLIYFQGLSANDRLQLLIQNWRVANYVENWSLAEHQYGFDPTFGFSPAIHVGNWQDLDGLRSDNSVALPFDVLATTGWLGREVTWTQRPGTADYPARPLSLVMFGSEYAIIHADPALAGTSQDLVVRVSPEGIRRLIDVDIPVIMSPCPGTVEKARDARLFTSIVKYSSDADSLFRHPELAMGVETRAVDVDSVGGDLEFVVTGFGTAVKAVVIVVSLGDGPSGFYSQQFGPVGDNTSSADISMPFRLSATLRREPFQLQNPATVIATTETRDDRPAWSPTGEELAFEATIPSVFPVQQIYRKPVAGGNAVRVAPSPLAQSSPDWSPRGDWVVFLQDSVGAPANDLMVVNMITGEVRMLAGDGVRQASPAFSPNGQQIAYAHQARVAVPQGVNVAWQIRCMSLDGTSNVALTTLTDLGPTDDLRWSPDGTRVYFTRRDSVFVVPKEGGWPAPSVGLGVGVASLDLHSGVGPVVLEDAGSFPWTRLCSLPAEVFCGCVPGEFGMPFRPLALRDTTTGDTQARFYRTGVEFFHPRWSPDGTRVAYSADQSVPGDRDLFVGQVSYNHAPQFSAPPRDTALALPCAPYTFAFNLSAIDPDGEAVAYQAAYLPPGATLVGNHFSWVNPGPPGSDHYVVFRALDGSGGVAGKVAKFTLLPDLARPAAAGDVTLETARYTATVTWTATGDDSLTGQACRFDVRYSTLPITESNFSSLTDTVVAGTPESAGAVHCAELLGLQSCKWYYVALKTCDDAGRWSALSNVGSAKTHCSGYADIFCDGGMYAQGGGGGGWSTEGAMLEGSPPGLLAVDGYQMKVGLEPTSGQYSLRLLQTGEGAVAVDEVALGVVDHAADVRAFLDRDRMVLGAASPAFQVTDASGRDVSDALRGGASLPFVSEPGQTLLVRLNESGTIGDALLLEAAAGGPAPSPDSSGILIQVPRGGDWATVAHHHPRRRFDCFLADSLGSATVRLVFLAEHPLRFVGRVAKTGVMTPQRLSLAGARHSRLGDASQAVGAAGGTAATLASGDALTLGFAAPPLAAGRVREWALFVRGTRVSARGTLATRAESTTPALPASFALYQNQPNPFAATTTLRFDLPRPETVRLEVFDLSGRRVVKLRDGWMTAGRHSVDWNRGDANGAPVRPGAYVYRLTAGSFRAHRKLVVLP